ncbi:MAG: hypothetical protein CO031_02785 [Candidatus Nealsonbacteria bacterium CG_4_9_14_0_2_um_filter_37_38]|uniref:4Fe-4S ferredoxin-type domain-containing protein n=1 Tax=Candidatus Nealsonbacteria bacterium CG_4_10_14_0_8_um_filter_37_14 TaxID=1974684 RepID=A0A2M7R6F6_9BACT|nr:MAG: hypothetical protein COV63_03510 [Candidatus Nealsonbacteria bacterium CG11_big_fil_rev_8_21_14_0_20_37_68]PIW91843.1 MAG: hypothetical protein COZ89_02985 [Candidatus Nealsonbacteria bacterium CG_4_8_14_3_um_filter_37_23]PIY88402.1 MAG: hypothetical protein COY73_03960 [Candidatus Nealsonbacteria bacterium CG_4_10_14_0_8_um_filter_37_14]PJC51415.1 MAG: hypothetical protein CO031_02785 [Candidatus Nealsonbacteria bacterium CG_4_9_14_0_2_um_filter_37_38]
MTYKVNPPKSRHQFEGGAWRVNKEKCVGCGACVAVCPEGIKMGKGGKAEIINQEKLEKCGGESLCQLGAIEKVQQKKTCKSHS